MYTVKIWAPSVSGVKLGEYSTIHEAAAAAASLCGARVTASHWSGHITQWGAKVTYAPHRDVPADAAAMIDVINSLAPLIERTVRVGCLTPHTEALTMGISRGS